MTSPSENGESAVTSSSDRLDALVSWNADWKGLRVAVLGLASTGFSVADTLAELGAEVLVVTETASEEYARLVPVIGARLWQGSLAEVPEDFIAFAPEVVVASPGFPPSHPVVAWAREKDDVALWGDIELAWRVRDKVPAASGAPAEWVFITGTNGKTTTTRLTATMLVEGGLRAAPCGNIGIPILDAVRDPAGFDVLVVELSSHQLWYLGLNDGPGSPVPFSSVCLNLADADAVREAFPVAQDQSRRGWVIVENFVTGRDYRCLIINGRMEAIAERVGSTPRLRSISAGSLSGSSSANPEMIGLSGRTSRPAARSCRQRIVVTSVLPTPVPTPVMKSPLMAPPIDQTWPCSFNRAAARSWSTPARVIFPEGTDRSPLTTRRPGSALSPALLRIEPCRSLTCCLSLTYCCTRSANGAGLVVWPGPCSRGTSVTAEPP